MWRGFVGKKFCSDGLWFIRSFVGVIECIVGKILGSGGFMLIQSVLLYQWSQMVSQYYSTTTQNSQVDDHVYEVERMSSPRRWKLNMFSFDGSFRQSKKAFSWTWGGNMERHKSRKQEILWMNWDGYERPALLFLPSCMSRNRHGPWCSWVGNCAKEASLLGEVLDWEYLFIYTSCRWDRCHGGHSGFCGHDLKMQYWVYASCISVDERLHI